jgi:cyclopropane fatty-acyl-phospholipid synthase-like methyltransferase
MSAPTREVLWDSRYGASEDYLFGTEPNAFLAAEAHRIGPGARVLAVADGEGRNGVFLAGRGAIVHAVDASAVALAKARRLAAQRGATLTFEQADLTRWSWPEAAYDAVVAIFVQFATQEERPSFFAGMQRALRPGGILLLEGYRPEQLDYRTGGPSEVGNLYTEAMLREAFGALEIVALRAHDAVLSEGARHSGMSALIDLIAVKR